MAKIKAPLFSLDTTGTIDNTLTYRKKPQNNTVSKYAKPGDVNPFESSPRQKDQRSIIALITCHWQCMPDSEKLTWEAQAKLARFQGSGYHYFLHLAKTDLTKYLGLVGYWSMNYNIGNKIPDLSGNANHGTLMPSYPSNCPQPVDSFNKKHGKALKFDGTDDCVNAGNRSSLNITNAITIEMWFKLNTLKDFNFLISKGNDNSESFEIYVRSAGSIKGDWLFTTGRIWGGILGTVTANRWYHLIWIFKKNVGHSVFLNAAQTGTTSITGDMTTNNLPLYIGNEQLLPTRFTNGIIDEVRIWNRALELEEIQRHYNLLI